MSELVEQLKNLFSLYGNQSYGPEPVTLLDHSMQCASLAQSHSLADTMIVAAGLHDIGHFLILDSGGVYDGGGDNHEHAGARFLANYLRTEVITPIRWHVEAKRYLVSAEPGYVETLSAGSIASMQLQGGPMSEVEMLTFRSVDGFEDAIVLRRLDDRAKQPSAKRLPLFEFLEIVDRVARESL